MTALDQRLARIIKTQGPIRFADYMGAAIEGYYSQGDPLGAHGDFTTAPEISQCFGEVIGLWLVEMWHSLGAPAEIAVIELGPGRGTLMADALRAAAIAPDFISAHRLHLIERNVDLRHQQVARLPHAMHHTTIDTVPDGPCLIVANEFLDCLPVRQLEMTAIGWRERYVTYDEQAQAFALCLPTGAPPVDHLVPAALRQAQIGAVFELSPQASAMSENLSLRVKDNGGAALLIDYGRATSQLGSSIQALKAHQPHNVLDAPGSADVTAHVDFYAVAQAASRHVQVFGPISQGVFLTRLGLSARVEALSAVTPERADEIAAQAQRLTAPDQMGELFQVLCLGYRLTHVPPGFE